MEEEIYRGQMPAELSYPLSNLGIYYRKLGEFDKAADVYNR